MTENTAQVIDFTEKAQGQIQSIFAAEADTEGKGLRVGVVGGGCSGLSYDIKFDSKRDKDNVIMLGEIEVYIDPKSSIYLKGTVLDFQDGLNGKGFVFNNPNASNTCGCGESFTV